MPKEWTDDEVASEISKAVQIVREDRIDALIRRRLSPPSNDGNDPKNNPPPSSGNPNDPGNGDKPKRKSLWWGETADLSTATNKRYQCQSGTAYANVESVQFVTVIHIPLMKKMT